MAERGENHLRKLLEETWKDHDAFPEDPDRPNRVPRLIGATALYMTPRFNQYVAKGLEASDETLAFLRAEIFSKALVFYAALTDGEIDDIPRIGEGALCISLMYLGNQSIGRDDRASEQACALLGLPETDEPLDAATILRLALYRHIEEGVAFFASEEDQPYVLPRFYEDVLQNDVWLQGLSRGYQKSDTRYAFLGQHAHELAERTTINAGFPSVTASLYATYRQHDDTLAPLAEVDNDPVIKELLQVCNVVARLWDNLGDWDKDNGRSGRDEFVINPFNQYHPEFIQRFCELAKINDQQTEAIRHHAEIFSRLHDDASKNYITLALRQHISDYLADIPAETLDRHGLYINLCKRVMAISWVNRIGDIALTAPTNE